MTAFVIDFAGTFTDNTLPTLKNYILDNFVTADRTLVVAQDGDVAVPWSFLNGSSPWSVVSGGARPTTSGASRQILGLDAGAADGEITTIITSIGSGMAGSGIVFRYVSSVDYCIVKYVVGTGYVVSHELNGVSTVVGSVAATAAANDVLTVRFIGASLTLTINGASSSVTFNYNLSATIHGLASLWTSANSPKFGKFEFTAGEDI
ncbi:hypothetical protein ACPCYX_11565 [Pseudomonas fluorescens]|uniref:hypothetical protein n=1 Tax=Pseudomonas fluorescens TaxID=294 RepID=UPI003C2257F2